MTPALRAAVAQALGDALGGPVEVGAHGHSAGGCINHAGPLRTSAGDYFMKWNGDGPAELFPAEAAGLEALRDAGALAVPRPICARAPAGRVPGFLVTELFTPGRRVADFDDRLGRGLARLHQATAAAHGFDRDTFCGLTRQPNGWLADWIDFYRERRLRPLVAACRFDPGERRLFDRLLDRLDELLGIDPEPPALIHGDLWSGNLHVTADGLPALIDPAACYGHREAELGMMQLFGGFSRRVYDVYHRERPLQADWRQRMPLYSLYHVLNHALLFGGGYGAQALSTARRFVG